MRSVGDSGRFLWVDMERNAGSGILGKQKDAQKSTEIMSPSAKAGLTHKRARAKLARGTMKERTLLAKAGREPPIAEKREKGNAAS